VPLSDIDGVTAIATSQEIISEVIIDALSSSQTQSLLITLVIATIVLMISFWFENRRPMLGVLTMLPVALVVFWTYGMMYATGIPFGPVTATLAALAVGIGVPFTIHIARRFEEDRQRFERWRTRSDRPPGTRGAHSPARPSRRWPDSESS
jgi:uncharacterized protein